MHLEINKEEQQQLMQCIDSAVKAAPNSLQAASVLLPLAVKIQQLTEEPDGNADA